MDENGQITTEEIIEQEQETDTNPEQQEQETDTNIIVEGSDPEQQEPETNEEVQVSTDEYQNFYSEQLELTNHLISGQIFFLGLIFGVLIFKIFWDRWKV